MINHNSHSSTNYPPPGHPPVVEKVKYIYKLWLPACRNLPKSERYNLGQKIDGLLVDILETLHHASFSPLQPKISFLGEALIKIDSLRFFLQLCWELKLLPTKNFTIIGQEVEEVGRMVGGWRKGLLAKTSPAEAGEEKK